MIKTTEGVGTPAYAEAVERRPKTSAEAHLFGCAFCLGWSMAGRCYPEQTAQCTQYANLAMRGERAGVIWHCNHDIKMKALGSYNIVRAYFVEAMGGDRPEDRGALRKPIEPTVHSVLFRRCGEDSEDPIETAWFRVSEVYNQTLVLWPGPQQDLIRVPLMNVKGSKQKRAGIIKGAAGWRTVVHVDTLRGWLVGK